MRRDCVGSVTSCTPINLSTEHTTSRLWASLRQLGCCTQTRLQFPLPPQTLAEHILMRTTCPNPGPNHRLTRGKLKRSIQPRQDLARDRFFAPLTAIVLAFISQHAWTCVTSLFLSPAPQDTSSCHLPDNLWLVATSSCPSPSSQTWFCALLVELGGPLAAVVFSRGHQLAASCSHFI